MKYLPLFMAALLLLAAFLVYDAKQETKAANRLVSGIQKNLQIKVDELGHKTTQVNDLKVYRDELLGVVDVQDLQLQKLQSVVKKNKQATSAVVFQALTEGKASGATTEIKYVTATVTDTIHAEYTGQVESDDFTANITAGKDSIHVNSYQVHNSFSVVQTTIKDTTGFFKPRISVVQVKAMNKASTVTDARSWSQPLPKQYTGLKIFGGVVVGFSAAIAIFQGF